MNMLIAYILAYMTVRQGKELNEGTNCRDATRKKGLKLAINQYKIFKHAG